MLKELNQHPDHHKTREELLNELEQLRLEVAKNQQTPLDRSTSPPRWRLKNNLLQGGLGLALLLLGSTGVASYFSIHKLTEDRQWVEHTHQVLEVIDETLDSLKDAERSRRGYIITSNPEFLATYRSATQITQTSLPNLRELTIDNPLQRQRLNELEPLIQQRFATLQRSLTLKQQDPSNQTAQINLTNEGRQLQQQLETLLTTMEQEEQALLVERSQAVDRSVRYTNLAVGISYILGFGLLAGIIWLLEKEIRQRRQAEAMVRQTNANLENLVQDRTTELTQTNQLLQTEIQERRQAEMALSQSERYLRAIVDAEPECVKVVTADGTLLNMNAAGLAMLEADRLEQVQGQCVCPLIEPAHQQAFLEFVQQIAQGGTGILEFEVIGLKGTRRWLESHAVPLIDPTEEVINVLAITRDVTDRKQKESQLRLLESVVHATNDAVLITEAEPIDQPGPRIVYVNPAFTAMTGYTPEEALGQTPRILQGEKTDRAALDQIRAALQTWQPVRVDLVNYRKDGSEFWVELNITPVADESGWFTHWVAVQRDVTDRKQAELALQQAKAELEHRVQERTAELKQRADEIQDLYNNAPCGYHSLDAEGRFVRANDTLLRWLGYDRDQLLGKSFADLLTPQSLRLFQENFHQFKQRGWVNNLEFELICQDGSLLSINLNATAIYDAVGNYLMSRSTLFDLRDRKHIEAALRDSEAKFRSLSESSPNGVLMTDAQGNTIYTNPRAQEICGYSFEEALGTGWMRFIHPEDLPQILAQQEKARPQPQHLTFNEIRHVHKDGTIRYGRVKVAPLLDTNGQFIGQVGTIEDITEQRQIDRMKNEFVSIVSHELRTPLTAIRGSLGLLANGVYDRKPEKGKKMLELALSQTDRLVRLVSDILDLKRLESGQVTLVKQSCEAATLMTQSAEAMQDLAQQNNITLSIAPLHASVWAAPDAIIQTLTNLLSNAIKFSPQGSTIWLSAELIETPDLPATQPPSHPSPPIRFAIKDQGRGIPPDKIEIIFGQFQQVDASDSRQKGGTGLGLAICRNIVQQHGGQIWVESVLGEGSTFYFTLPTVREEG